MTTTTRYLYRFKDGSADMRDLLGGKGANLCEMASLGLPIPPGFVISTDAFREYHANNRQIPEEMWNDIRDHVAEIEEAAGKKFGDRANPLLVSVRSGSKFSMPGMMDTILNLGLTDETVLGLAEVSQDKRFAYDSYRRFVQMFSKVALGHDPEPFEHVLTEERQKAGVDSDAGLDEVAMQRVADRFKEIASHGPKPLPSDPWEQLQIAIRAVFDSWTNERAIAYRNYAGIPHDLGTAVNIMAMVFGNSGWDSGTGVCFSRNPSTGERKLFGEYLPNAQGEDVVAGVRTPKPITELQSEMPGIYDELNTHAENLEQHFRDMQDIEFTIEGGRLYILQTRSGKRTAQAAVRAAVEMVDEGLISRDEAVLRVPAPELAHLLSPRFLDDAKTKAIEEGRLLGRGLNASPGAATGRAVFDPRAVNGPTDILVRPETSADDMPGILKAAAVLTSRGGNTSHAAVVTRGLGKPAVVGCSDIRVDERNGEMHANGQVVKDGEWISIDGFTGEVFAGAIDTIQPDLSSNEELRRLLQWADEFRRLRVRANADTPEDAERARSFGAEGIGLCRTEHMFFQTERLPHVRAMLMNAEHAGGVQTAEASQGVDRQAYLDALTQLEEYQAADFKGILEAMDGLPVVIRLLDAPLHEFLPSLESLAIEVAVARATSKDADIADKELLLEHARSLHEINPMLGHRGSRVGITDPEIYAMQVRAILRAAQALKAEGKDPRPEVMVPIVVEKQEVQAIRERLTKVAQELGAGLGRPAPVHFGTMIEVPRAALLAGEIAPGVDFFSFGSNDLTQMTFGFSRDDAEEKFLRFYVENGILATNPFDNIDESGVGRLIRIACEEGRAANPDIELGLCGEHGGDPKSVLFCHSVGLHYVSCSPPRIAGARLAAAQAAIGATERDV
ncbi:MAG TPA: pyruvate, phosphate dikinase [Dehalococcoidia bacterium]|nr:pyruvate, phosphate dikinase [Dehalococcoidia bacterium]